MLRKIDATTIIIPETKIKPTIALATRYLKKYFFTPSKNTFREILLLRANFPI